MRSKASRWAMSTGSAGDAMPAATRVAQARTSSPSTLTMQVSQLWMGPIGVQVADLRDADAAVRGGGAIDGLDQGLARLGGNRLAVDLDRSIRSQDDRSIQQWLRVIFSVVHSR